MKRLTAIAALSDLLLLISPSQIHAACEGDKRVSSEKAGCLVTRQWRTRGFFSTRDHVQAKNLCPQWGKVVVKVDIKNGGDATWTLSDGQWRSGSWGLPGHGERSQLLQ